MAFSRSRRTVAATPTIEAFLRRLRDAPSGAVFNPWWQMDAENDADFRAPQIRRRHLRGYLRHRLGKARIVIIGEALGYRGGHFSGIPMTSERMLLGKHPSVKPWKIVPGIMLCRTSKIEMCDHGFSEPTASLVWGTLSELGADPDEFILWNAFPWHSFDQRHGRLSNRMPNNNECIAGLSILKEFLDLFPWERIVALGKIAAKQLKKLGVDAVCVRHPASGGATLFRQQMANLIRGKFSPR